MKIRQNIVFTVNKYALLVLVKGRAVWIHTDRSHRDSTNADYLFIIWQKTLKINQRYNNEVRDLNPRELINLWIPLLKKNE